MRIDINQQILQLDERPIEYGDIPTSIQVPAGTSEDDALKLVDEQHRKKYEAIGSTKTLYKLKPEFREFLTLRTVITGALLHFTEEDKGIKKETVAEFGHLAMEVHRTKESHFDFSEEQRTMLKDRINRKWASNSPIIVAQALDMISDPKEPETKSNDELSPQRPNGDAEVIQSGTNIG